MGARKRSENFKNSFHFYRRYSKPHRNVRNQVLVPQLDWYFRIRIACGTGSRPTSVPRCRNFKISFSSVIFLGEEKESQDTDSPVEEKSFTCRCRFSPLGAPGLAADAWLWSTGVWASTFGSENFKKKHSHIQFGNWKGKLEPFGWPSQAWEARDESRRCCCWWRLTASCAADAVVSVCSSVIRCRNSKTKRGKSHENFVKKIWIFFCG